MLNNTTRAHLAARAADQFRAGGWQVVKVGNFTGTIPSTTVYFTPGSGAEQPRRFGPHLSPVAAGDVTGLLTDLRLELMPLQIDAERLVADHHADDVDRG